MTTPKFTFLGDPAALSWYLDIPPGNTRSVYLLSISFIIYYISYYIENVKKYGKIIDKSKTE
jgi:hypothetical protein